jgi:PAS domain S-box-containing protein
VLEITVPERTFELRRSERELRDVVDIIPAIVWSALPDGSNAYVNSRFVEYSGMSAEQLAGSGWHAATHSDDLQRHERKWLACVCKGEVFEDEVRFRRADDDTNKGRHRRFADTLRPAGEETGIIAGIYNTDFLQAISLFHTRDRRRAAEDAGKRGKELPAVTGNRQALLNLPLEEHKRYEAKVERLCAGCEVPAHAPHLSHL